MVDQLYGFTEEVFKRDASMKQYFSANYRGFMQEPIAYYWL